MKKDHKEEAEEKSGETAACREAATAQPKETAGAEMEKELEKQTGLAKEYYDQLLRSRAEFENYRKRVEREKPELIKYGKAEMLMKLLPLYDMLLSANGHLCALKGSCSNDVVKGLEMIFKEFEKVFECEGLRPMCPVGKPYDPMACEILGVVDGDDSNDGLVVEELQKGFFFGDKILRPARVKIARRKQDKKEQCASADADGADKDSGKKD